MEFKNTIKINAPQEFVSSYIRRTEYFNQWQDDFQSATLLSGVKDQQGAKTKLTYKFGKSDMELVETIRENNLPHYFEALYEHKHMDNTMLSTFEDAGDNTTLYTTHVDYIKLKGIMIKIMVRLFSGKFKKGPEKWMQQFKTLVETEYQKSRS